MIKFHSLELHNFALYPEETLQFSVDPERPLTVIRGENESGKTTLMRAFLWVLYGVTGLPALENSMHPVRPIWAQDEEVWTRVDLRFDVRGAGRTQSYKITRQAKTFVVNGHVRYESERPALLQRNLDGDWDQASDTQMLLLLNRYFREDLRDFFFIDADKAIRFVGGPENAHDPRLMRNTATTAIYSLLGLDSLRGAIERLTAKESDYRRQAARKSSSVDKQELAKRVEAAEDRKKAAQAELQRLQHDEAEATELALANQRKLDSLVAKLASSNAILEQISAKKDSLSKAKERRAEVISQLAGLIDSDERVAASLMLDVLEPVISQLDPLYRDGRIPRSELTLLPRLLKEGICVCGVKFDDEPQRRRVVERRHQHSLELNNGSGDHLVSVLESSRKLANRAIGNGAGAWSADVARHQSELAELDDKINTLQTEIDTLNSQKTTGLPSDSIIHELQQQANSSRELAERLKGQRLDADASVAEAEKEVRSLGEQLRTALKGEERSRDQQDKAAVAEDLKKVLQKVLGAVESDQVTELSQLTNQIFRDVIGATDDSNFSEVGVRAVPGGVTRVQYEPFAMDGEKEKPLGIANGGSRRALAVAFVLALAESTGSRVPFVADSLLHAFSGAVRQRLVKYIIDGKRVGQPILFGLTSELLDNAIAEPLTEAGGRTYTLTSQAHVGKDVVRAASSATQARQTVICGCGVTQYCDVCERVNYSNMPELHHISHQGTF